MLALSALVRHVSYMTDFGKGPRAGSGCGGNCLTGRLQTAHRHRAIAKGQVLGSAERQALSRRTSACRRHTRGAGRDRTRGFGSRISRLHVVSGGRQDQDRAVLAHASHGRPVREPMNDIKAVKWVSLKQAIDSLTRSHEKVFLATVGPAALKATKQSVRGKSAKQTARNGSKRRGQRAPFAAADATRRTGVGAVIRRRSVRAAKMARHGRMSSSP